MDRTPERLDALTRSERRALRRLLVAAVVAADRPGRGDDIERLTSVAPVRALPSAAALHRVSGIVLRGLDGVAAVPDDVRATIERQRNRSALHHLLVIGGLSEIIRLFDERGFEWVSMKGPVVAELLYRDPRDRTYADLDILVVRDQFPDAMRALEELGYAPTIKNWALAERMLAGQVELTGHAIRIDLHWALHYSDDDRRPYAFTPEDMIGRSRFVDVAGIRVPTFDATDTLISLAFHAARSGGHRLLWLKDLERSIAVDNPDLDDVVRRAQTCRCDLPVGVMLDRAARVLQADVPADIVRTLLPRSVRSTNRAVERLVPPVQMHGGGTLTQWSTRSWRATMTGTASEIPRRALNRLRRAADHTPPNETNDPAEKARYLDAVVRSGFAAVD